MSRPESRSKVTRRGDARLGVVHTFVVRLAPVTDPTDPWHGVVRRVADGHEATFCGSDELLSLLSSGPEHSPGQPDQRA